MTQLDVHTLLGLLAVLNIFLSVVMVLYWRTQRVYPGFGLWTLCNAFVAIMWILFFLRGSIAIGVSVIVPNVLAGIAVILRLEGLRRFLGRPRFDPRTLALPAVMLALYAVFFYVDDDVYARTGVTTFSVGLVVWIMAALVLTRARGARRFTFGIIGVLWLLYGGLNIARGVYWLVMYEGNPLMQPGAMNELYYVATMVFDIAWTVVFITMNHQRTAFDLQTAQKTAEEGRDRLAGIIAFLPDATFAVDRDMRVTAYNHAAEELIGVPTADVLGKPYGDVVAPALADSRPILLDLALDAALPIPERYSTVVRDGDKVMAEVDRVELGGRRLSLWTTASTLRDDSGEVVGAIESIRDITALKRAENERAELRRRLQEGQRLESLGTMAGGIAHDFNNLLAIIMGNLELAAADAPADSQQARHIAGAMRAGARAAALTENMRAYAGASALYLAPVDIEGLVSENLSVLKGIAGDSVRLEFAPEPTPLVSGDKVGLLRAVSALVENAAESMGERDGSVVVSTGLMDCDERLVARSILAEKPAPGLFAFVRVSDTGQGMSSETVNRMLEPFFTTKFTGRGLGLSAASGIVSAHGGAMLVDSRPAYGTDVVVLLPVVAGQS